jgi:hypothetical protein
MAGDGPDCFQSEERATWPLFFVLENILLAGLILRVISDRFFVNTICIHQKKVSDSSRPKKAGIQTSRWINLQAFPASLPLALVLCVIKVRSDQSEPNRFTERLLYLTFLLEINMSFSGKPVPINTKPTGPKTQEGAAGSRASTSVAQSAANRAKTAGRGRAKQNRSCCSETFRHKKAR